MRFKRMVIIVMCLTLLTGCSLSSENKKEVISDDNLIVSIQPEEIVYAEDLKVIDFTSTGLTYDSASDTYWIGDHGSESTDPVQLIQINSDMTSVCSTIQIENYINDGDINLQGIAYDPDDDMIWCAIGKSIIEVTKDGNIINSYTNDYFNNFSANGIAYDSTDSSLWVLCYSKKLLHLSREGDIIEEFDVDYPDQDMIFVKDSKIYITIGADYNGNNNYLAVFDKETHEVSFDYRLDDSYAIEGLIVKDGYLFVANDGLYHKCSIPKTYISKYLFQ